MDYCYTTKPCATLTDSDYAQCSELFSNHYGKYSGLDGVHAKGQRIRMGVSVYKRYYSGRDDMFVSRCFIGEKLIGQAFFLKKNIAGKGICVWVTQLLVHSSYRKRGIGTRLLQSAWGMSNYFAWGLATANAKTIKTLESVTWRRVSLTDIAANIEAISTLAESVPFASSDNIRLSDKLAQIFSNFYPEFEEANSQGDLPVYASRLGSIDSGCEWLAFTFATQKMEYTQERFKQFLDFSEQQLKDAYSRMKMPVQHWAKNTESEVDYIIQATGISADSKILDLGCGQGRHCNALSRRGYKSVVGIDFSESNIDQARQNAVSEHLPTAFLVGDARTFKSGDRYDCILCVYDVIGSFRDNGDNEKIVRTIKRELKAGGRAVVSVMNMELTEAQAKYKVSFSADYMPLLHLAPSKTMAESGDVFNPVYYIINTDDDLVYHKEQFVEDGMLSAEYLVADRRYRRSDIIRMFESAGLKVLSTAYVSAKDWTEELDATDKHAKEILVVVESVEAGQ